MMDLEGVRKAKPEIFKAVATQGETRCLGWSVIKYLEWGPLLRGHWQTVQGQESEGTS